MEGHAAMPDHEDLEWIVHEVFGTVEQHFTQAPADHHAQHAVEQHVIEVFLLPAQYGDVRLLDAHSAQDNEQGKGQHIHQAVPVHGERADLDGYRVGHRVYQHGVSFFV